MMAKAEKRRGLSESEEEGLEGEMVRRREKKSRVGGDGDVSMGLGLGGSDSPRPISSDSNQSQSQQSQSISHPSSSSDSRSRSVLTSSSLSPVSTIGKSISQDSGSGSVHFISDDAAAAAVACASPETSGEFDASQNTTWTTESSGEFDASQSTVVTEPEEGGFHLPVVAGAAMTTTMASSSSSRLLPRLSEAEKRERIRQLTHKLRVKLVYAKYKVDTHQVHVPLDELEVRHVAPPSTKAGNPGGEQRDITDSATAISNTQEEDNAPLNLPTAPEDQQPTPSNSNSNFRSPTPEKFPQPPPRGPRSPRSLLRDLGFDSDSSCDSSNADDGEKRRQPRKMVVPYSYRASRGGNHPSKLPLPDLDVDACDGLLSLSRGVE